MLMRKRFTENGFDYIQRSSRNPELKRLRVQAAPRYDATFSIVANVRRAARLLRRFCGTPRDTHDVFVVEIADPRFGESESLLEAAIFLTLRQLSDLTTAEVHRVGDRVGRPCWEFEFVHNPISITAFAPCLAPADPGDTFGLSSSFLLFRHAAMPRCTEVAALRVWDEEIRCVPSATAPHRAKRPALKPTAQRNRPILMPWTPLTKLRVADRTVLLKREDMNPFGSHKIHAVLNYLEHLYAIGRLPTATPLQLLASSSGRFIQALAMVTEGLNIQLRLVTDVLSSSALLDELSRFNHVIIDEPLIDSPDKTGSHLRARLDRIQELARQWPGSIFVDQYQDPILATGYQKTLLPQIAQQAGGEIGGLVIPVGTGGQINGAVRYRKQQRANWPIFAADAEGSALLRTPPGNMKRKLPGYGNGIRTKLIAEVTEDILPVWVADADAVAACHKLRDQGVWVGPSSGAAVAAWMQVIRDTPERVHTDKPVVIVLPDSGDPYLSSVYDPLWLKNNGFQVPKSHRRAA